MDLCVIGASGLLGSNVVAAGQARGWHVTGTYHSTEPEFEIPLTELDLEHASAVGALLDATQPDLVVNCAAMTDVDCCESSPERAHQINGTAPGTIAEHCEQRGCDLVHVSTDYVFDGTQGERYTEADDPNPRQVYGASKLTGEQRVQAVTDDAIIARLSFVYGIHRGRDELDGFPAWVCEQLASAGSVSLFADQHVTPTRAGQAAATLLDLAAADRTGCHNVACRSCVTPHDVGTQVLRLTDVSPDALEEISMADVSLPADRPAHTCLDVSRVEAALDRPQPTLAEDLAHISDWIQV